MTEREENEPSLEEVLSEFDIHPLSPESLDSGIAFLNGSTPLSLREALPLSPEELMGPSLKIIMAVEDAATQPDKHGGDRRSSREIDQIRGQFEKERNRLWAVAPGRVLAAIAANPNKKAKWTSEGLKGGNGDWIAPDENESRWWNWVLGQKREGVRVEDWWGDPKNMVNFLHAFFIMRCRQGSLPPGVYDEFVRKITPLVSEDNEPLVANLRAIARRFSS